MLDLSKMELSQVQPPTDEEMLEEAKAWGFDTVEEWLSAMDEAAAEALAEADEMMQNMRMYGTIDKPQEGYRP